MIPCTTTLIFYQASFCVTHLGEALLVVVLELQGVDVKLVLVGSVGEVELGLLREELFDLHRHPLTVVLKRLDRNVRGRPRI